MGLRYRDLVIDVVQMAPAPAGPCGCTATAPNCVKSQNLNPRPACVKPSGAKPPKKRLGENIPGGLEALREQLRAELRP